MTDTITEHYVLTAQDVRALKHCDSLCFDHGMAHTGNDSGGQIRALLRGDTSPTGYEQTHRIPAALSRVQDYERGDRVFDGTYTAFASINSAQFSGEARTLIRHLRVGSRFSFEWVRNNSSELTREAGLVVDQLRVHVQGKGAKVADVFLMDVFVGRDNSARMVKRVW